eukprot:TRINITY_DN1288_c0_g1_i2.p2 TRINITY_DN1288_c0_g1~~TRINITY_DN1288_c0_g1_i2.p2  ORF type:complete len:144 (+),score=34.70 TRINITY_DN1288_c0_g1_i2:300-731(+)
MKTMEPSMETMEPSMETMEPSMETMEPSMETMEPSMETMEPSMKTEVPAGYTDPDYKTAPPAATVCPHEGPVNGLSIPDCFSVPPEGRCLYFPSLVDALRWCCSEPTCTGVTRSDGMFEPRQSSSPQDAHPNTASWFVEGGAR